MRAQHGTRRRSILQGVEASPMSLGASLFGLLQGMIAAEMDGK